jgi:uncharacterized protein
MPGCGCFGPSLGPGEITLALDEFEAVRLADFEGLYQERAAERMDVSRQTFGRIVEAARRKIAQALIEGKTLSIEGGAVEMTTVKCSNCRHDCEVPAGAERPQACPRCRNAEPHRAEEENGQGRRHRCGCRRAAP